MSAPCVEAGQNLVDKAAVAHVFTRKKRAQIQYNTHIQPVHRYIWDCFVVFTSATCVEAAQNLGNKAVVDLVG